MAAKQIFTLSSGRSGTKYIASFFKHNVHDCFSTHEPYLQLNNPTLFGQAIAWNTRENDSLLLPLLQKKLGCIQNVSTSIYFEANHALVKSANRHIHELFPQALFIHLFRHPKKVAKSELIREQVIRRFCIPFIEYETESHSRLFRWSLSGSEHLFQLFERLPEYSMSRFGFYVLQWCEIEYRIQQILSRYNNDRCFIMNVDQDFRSRTRWKAMLDYFDITHKPDFSLDLQKNRTWFASDNQLSQEEEVEFAYIFKHLPTEYQMCLRHPCYAQLNLAEYLP